MLQLGHHAFGEIPGELLVSGECEQVFEFENKVKVQAVQQLLVVFDFDGQKLQGRTGVR